MLAQKMKDLNMVDLRDVEHASDYEFSDLGTSSSVNGSRRKSRLFQSLRPSRSATL
ncbi:hypothetical protein F2Q70_00040100 [Brassica cretica]|uniref:Uncharacterized protein n=1 Tax=Brassica cretica TaxID=69181 RepID=A0A8S9K8A0_BRACR|nr:hypothetical protein F2Q70_00040100 [Brassica cretica]